MDPLLDNVPRKKPIVLYIIIGVLAVVVIVLSILLGIKSAEKEENKNPETPKPSDSVQPSDTTEPSDTTVPSDSTEPSDSAEPSEPINPVKPEHLIPIKESFYVDDTDDAATKYKGRGTHLNSEYYKILDIYNMQPTANRSILTHFKTYQQTSEYTSPCAMIIMILTYFGIEPPGERTCALSFGLNPEDEKLAKGTYNQDLIFQTCTIANISKKLREYGLEVESSGNYTEDTMPFQDEFEFLPWLKNNIEEGNILLVLYNDWGGQFGIIIGVDDMGTEDTNDDILIFADDYDTTDHLQDGYTIWSFERFYYLWQYSHIIFYEDDDSLNHGQFILVKKPKNNGN